MPRPSRWFFRVEEGGAAGRKADKDPVLDSSTRTKALHIRWTLGAMGTGRGGPDPYLHHSYDRGGLGNRSHPPAHAGHPPPAGPGGLARCRKRSILSSEPSSALRVGGSSGPSRFHPGQLAQERPTLLHRGSWKLILGRSRLPLPPTPRSVRRDGPSLGPTPQSGDLLSHGHRERNRAPNLPPQTFGCQVCIPGESGV